MAVLARRDHSRNLYPLVRCHLVSKEKFRYDNEKLIATAGPHQVHGTIVVQDGAAHFLLIDSSHETSARKSHLRSCGSVNRSLPLSKCNDRCDWETEDRCEMSTGTFVPLVNAACGPWIRAQM